MSKLAALVAAVLAFAACSNPSPACATGQSECDGTCVFLASDLHNCGACGNTCSTGQACLSSKCNSTTCDKPDVFATCWIGGGVIGICSDTGIQTAQAVVALAPGDAGEIVGAPEPQYYSEVFTGSSKLWLLDWANNQIDIVDTATWPPAPVIGISAATSKGTSDFGYSVSQLVVCDGMVLALRTGTPLLEAYDPTTYALINEVSLASDSGTQFPAAMACDGQHTAYVTDSDNNTVTAVDLTTFQITAVASLPAADQIGALPDGGFISAALTAVAVESASAGTKVLVATQNLDSSYLPAANTTVFELSADLSTWSAGVSPEAMADGGFGCLDPFQMTVSSDQKAYLACAGILNTAGATTVQPYNPTGNVGVIAGDAAAPTLVTTLSNPTSVAILKNGLVAIGDYTPQSEVAFYNPADGGLTYVSVNCPTSLDGSLFPSQGITAVLAVP